MQNSYSNENYAGFWVRLAAYVIDSVIVAIGLLVVRLAWIGIGALISGTILDENVRKIYPNISLGTVYRNLSLLSELGEIQKLSNFGGADHFDGCVTPHCHFMCKKCGQVLDLETEDLNEVAEKAVKNFSGKITECDIRFFGICPKCMNN